MVPAQGPFLLCFIPDVVQYILSIDASDQIDTPDNKHNERLCLIITPVAAAAAAAAWQRGSGKATVKRTKQRSQKTN